MPIRTIESPATRKAWSPEIAANAAGLTLAPFDVLFIGDAYDVPAIAAPCVAPGSYRLALVCSDAGAAIALVDDAGLPDGCKELVYLARWTLREGQTCVDAEIEVTRRVLVEREPTVMDVPVYETRPKLGDDGEPLVDDDGAPVTETVEVGTEQVTIPPEALPEPTRHVVSSTLVLPRARTAQERFDAIDAKTRERIAQGVVFKGVRCSLSIEAQMRMLGACVAAQTLAYPIAWNSLDDTEVLSLDNAGEVLAFYGAGMQALRDAVDAGTVLKDAVRAEVLP